MSMPTRYVEPMPMKLKSDYPKDGGPFNDDELSLRVDDVVVVIGEMATDVTNAKQERVKWYFVFNHDKKLSRANLSQGAPPLVVGLVSSDFCEPSPSDAIDLVAAKEQIKGAHDAIAAYLAQFSDAPAAPAAPAATAATVAGGGAKGRRRPKPKPKPKV